MTSQQSEGRDEIKLPFRRPSTPPTPFSLALDRVAKRLGVERNADDRVDIGELVEAMDRYLESDLIYDRKDDA